MPEAEIGPALHADNQNDACRFCEAVGYSVEMSLKTIPNAWTAIGTI